MKYFKILAILAWLLALPAVGQEKTELAVGHVVSVIDLKTNAGTTLTQSTWRTADVEIVPADFKAPGAGTSDKHLIYPTGKAIKTNDIRPKAGAVGFDDKNWQVLQPSQLEERRGNGLISMVWYRLTITIPETAGNFSTKGSTAIFEIIVDDYSEIWVNGKLNTYFGQAGEGTISGYNARNRVVLTEDARPGQQFQLAILAINGPLADVPENYIWVRSATVDFYAAPPAPAGWDSVGQVIRIQKEADNILPADARIEKVATGFQFTEGPVWHPDGFLLFSDPNTNVIYRYSPVSRNVSVYISKSGYTGLDIGSYHQPGSNGLAIDPLSGLLTVCQHGNRRIIQHEKKGPVDVLSDNYEGKKLNSPNDLVYKSDGTLYFTDPPYGLPKAFDDPGKQTPFSGVYRIKDGKTQLLTTDLKGPNGIAFSPDEKYLYVSNWDITDIHNTKVLMRYPVLPDGTLGKGIVFFDMNHTDDDEALDGLKIDEQGNIFSSAPGGVWIISPQGKYLGKIVCPERPANMAWGDDGHTLYMTAHSSVYKIRLKTAGKIAKPVLPK